MLANILVLAGVLIFHGTLGEFTAQDCRELGFIKGQLMCSSCEKLDDFALESLKPHCRECCTLDQMPAAYRYPKAILEVCTCKFRAYPQIQAFIKSGRPSKFPNLTIKYVRGLDPIVKLLDKEGRVKETLSITKWNTDTVEEFFETHLESVASTGGKQSFSVIEEEDDDYLKTNRV
ncbi:selenoprotein F [Stomoxys calcitrans]|uniref:Selenoprotein F n=1 Tax=Stomoxys calcitrans TaxID=35570 RepID=A0A1I8NMY8_STOCA|nr:selenoprotein F [Stomoxys calcitrans]